MNESAHGTAAAQPDLALLAASGLLPRVWGQGRWAEGEAGADGAGEAKSDGPDVRTGPDRQTRADVHTRADRAGEDAGGSRADHRSYLPDLVAEACWSAIEAGALLGFGPDVAPRALDWLRRSGVVIGLPRARGTVYPRFQFDASGRRVHRVVAVVNVWLGTAGDPYAAAVWWLRAGPGGLRPRDLVGTPDEGRVIDFAAAHISGRVLCAGAARVPEGGRRVIRTEVPAATPREHRAGATETAPAPSDGTAAAHSGPPTPAPSNVPSPAPSDEPTRPPSRPPTPAPIEPIPRGAGIFGRHPRQA